VDLLGLYTPDVTDSFTLLSYGSHSGAFADIELPLLPEEAFRDGVLSYAFILWVSEDDPRGG
jgi:hypothetical protein